MLTKHPRSRTSSCRCSHCFNETLAPLKDPDESGLEALLGPSQGLPETESVWRKSRCRTVCGQLFEETILTVVCFWFLLDALELAKDSKLYRVFYLYMKQVQNYKPKMQLLNLKQPHAASTYVDKPLAWTWWKNQQLWTFGGARGSLDEDICWIDIETCFRWYVFSWHQCAVCSWCSSDAHECILSSVSGFGHIEDQGNGDLFLQTNVLGLQKFPSEMKGSVEGYEGVPSCSCQVSAESANHTFSTDTWHFLGIV